MAKTVLVTGGAGYVGAVLVPKLLSHGYKVKVLDWYLYGDVFHSFRDSRLVQVKGDIRDRELLKRELHSIDAVIHLACISNDPSFDLDPVLGKSVNYDGTILLIDIAREMGVKRFIYASSSSVYGLKLETQVTEDLSTTPLTGYSTYKALCETYLLGKQTKDFTVCILRPATICGYSPRLRLDLIVNMLTTQAIVNKKITVFGGGQLRPNIHIEDITDLYVNMLVYPKKKIAGAIYNAGYKNYSLYQIATLIKQTLNDKTIDIVTVPTDDQRSYHISSEKIHKELGFMPKHTVENAIMDLKKAFGKGYVVDALTNDLYYNAKTMKKFNKTITMSS